MPLREACGVVGISTTTPALHNLLIGLRALQHRGQESAGVALFDGEHLTRRGMGLVAEALTNFETRFHDAVTGIGHVRYSTAGDSSLRNAQPITASFATGELSLAHNGTISNQQELREHWETEGAAFMSDTDSEIIVRLIAHRLPHAGSMIGAIREAMGRMVGSYSIAMLHNDELFAFRDPFGIKPLCLGELPDGHIVASESVALDAIGATFVRDITPGEIVQLTPNGVVSHPPPSGGEHAFCMFEYVYFARPDSRMDGTLAYSVRQELGRQLWREHPVEADLVVPVPDSGIAHALGFAEAAGIPYREGLIKNRYVWRSFIQPHDAQRKATINEKLNPIREFLEGKRVVLIDDSIVRGNTSRRIVARVREAGAKEVHLRVGCPPIISPCYLGIDMPSREEFIAPGKSMKEITRDVGADSVAYISIDGLVRAVGKPHSELCLGCINEEYPVPIPGERVRGQATLEEFEA